MTIRRILAITALLPLLLLAQPRDRFAGIAPAMQAFADRGEIAGAVTLIADKDRILHLAAAGKSDLSTGRAMRTDDIFWIASMSKPITAVCIAILADEGKLKFDDPVAKHLPEFDSLMVNENGAREKPTRPVTLRDLLTHISGMDEMRTRDPHLTLAETSNRIAQ